MACNKTERGKEGPGILEAMLVPLRNRTGHGGASACMAGWAYNAVGQSSDIRAKPERKEKKYTHSKKEVTSWVTGLQFSEVEVMEGLNHIVCGGVFVFCVFGWSFFLFWYLVRFDCKMARVLGHGLEDLASAPGSSSPLSAGPFLRVDMVPSRVPRTPSQPRVSRAEKSLPPSVRLGR